MRKTLRMAVNSTIVGDLSTSSTRGFSQLGHSIMSGRIASQYAGAADVPLIKAPTLWLQRPVEMPKDIHPLPDDISAYFVYPFSLEPHVLAQRPPIHERIQRQRAENNQILSERIERVRKAKEDEMNRIAPGWKPNNSVLLPEHLNSTTSTGTQSTNDSQDNSSAGHDPRVEQTRTDAASQATASAQDQSPASLLQGLKIGPS